MGSWLFLDERARKLCLVFLDGSLLFQRDQEVVGQPHLLGWELVGTSLSDWAFGRLGWGVRSVADLEALVHLLGLPFRRCLLRACHFQLYRLRPCHFLKLRPQLVQSQRHRHRIHHTSLFLRITLQLYRNSQYRLQSNIRSQRTLLPHPWKLIP